MFFLEQTHAGDGFPFGANNDPARNTIPDFGDCFLHSQEILHSILSKQGNNLLQTKSDSWPVHVKLMVPSMHFINLRGRMGKSASEDPVKTPCKVSQVMSYRQKFISEANMPFCASLSSIARIYGPVI